ncbi:MAG: hypothetical protein RLY86_1480 [Pseudomonadota bacterium]|jgi:opacity protein-like surface antigen
MRKLSMAIGGMAVLLAFPAAAQRAGDVYVQGNIASSWGEDRLGHSAVWGLAAGRHMTRNLRLELSADWRGGYEFKLDRSASAFGTASVDSAAYMANLYWDFYPDRGTVRGLTPYVGAGFGFAQHETKDAVLSLGTDGLLSVGGRDTDRFAWQVMGGVTIDTGGSSFGRFGYRYIDHGTARLGVAGAAPTRSVQAHELTAALGFRF